MDANLKHYTKTSIYQIGRFWEVTYLTMNGTFIKVFENEQDARKFYNS